MNGPLGRLLILAALATAVAAAILGWAASRNPTETRLRWARGLATASAWLSIGANFVMWNALLGHDFSVSYVAQVGSRATPLHITIVSLWSSLEGSILFWGLVLGLYTLALLRSLRGRDPDLQGAAIFATMAVAAFFAFLLAGPASPFHTLSPAPADGPGPNPLLQNHPLMIVHPPTLYAGYVGMTIPFALGVAALMQGRIGPAWLRLVRTWMLVPWGFQTAGIVLGGWWAYEVLGWGGYWAWDPVENASFLPWLTASAFLHAAMLEERRGMLRGWTMVLLLATFSLTILGTFMTRSGVFNSVHSFTQSPIGPLFLGFLAVVLLFSILLLSFRMHLLEPRGEVGSPWSREAAFIVNNLIFVAFTFTVLVGTVFPLLAEAIRDVKVSVGEPFFNQLGVPIAVFLVFMMGVGPALPWGRGKEGESAAALIVPAGAATVVTLVAAAAGVRSFWPAITLFVSAFAMSVAFRDMAAPVVVQRRRGLGWGPAMGEAFRRGRRRYGGQVVHVGVALLAVAIALSENYQQATETVVRRGESLTVGQYGIVFEGARTEVEPHRRSIVAELRVSRGGEDLGVFEPRMNHYKGQMSPIGTPEVRSGLLEDLYLSVMHVDEAGTTLGVRALVNPAVPWLWVAAGIMLLGCGIALWPSGSRRLEPAA